MNDTRQLVGTMLRRHRVKARLTQAQLAEKVGRSLELIGRIEQGKAAPSFDTLSAFAEALETPIAEFFGKEMPPTGRDPFNRIVSRLSRMDAADLEWVERILIAVASRGERR